ncbi:MAG: hypothetical protein HY897_15300 [Deltaproteobacteria bacterium]|nr:hypothetical protein [Deltaproteobacteria bacterium]
MKRLQEKIERIKTQLAAIDDMTPGSISKQYNVCGSPTCRCKDPVRPVKHGPYYQLSYTRKGRSTSRFVKKEDVALVRRQVKNYARFRKLVESWVDAAMELAALNLKARRQG